MTDTNSTTRKIGKHHLVARFYSDNKAVFAAEVEQYKAQGRIYKIVGSKGVLVNGQQAKGKVIFA